MNQAFIKKRFCRNTRYALIILLCCSLNGCSVKYDDSKAKNQDGSLKAGNSPVTQTPPDTAAEENESTVNQEVKEAAPIIEEVNYKDCFEGINGCAVFYNSSIREYRMYNKELCEEQASPCSTFKIISSLMGLENGIIASPDSTMGYNGTVYPIDSWNKDLGLKDAFNESCIWYFRKVIDRLGQVEVQKWITGLGYGNGDISEWEGSGINPMSDLNGFWLNSSLEISPKEQVNILSDIFEGRTEFSETNIALLQDLMLTREDAGISIYGKTGTGKNAATGNSNSGWYVGMLKNSYNQYYFAIRLSDENHTDINGQKAKEIANKIITKYYPDK